MGSDELEVRKLSNQALIGIAEGRGYSRDFFSILAAKEEMIRRGL